MSKLIEGWINIVCNGEIFINGELKFNNGAVSMWVNPEMGSIDSLSSYSNKKLSDTEVKILYNVGE